MSEQGPLQFDPEAMRAIGHRTVDALGLDDGVRVPARREPDLVPGWATSPSVAAPDVSWVPLFAAMGAEEAADLLARAAERRLEPGETLIEQWDAGRDCFVILDA